MSRLRDAGCVFAEEEAHLLVSDAGTPEALATMAARRIAGEPLEQVLGWASFRGIRVALLPGVFVPRRRTEFLAASTIDLLRGRHRPVVVELCSGSGAVAMAVSAALPLGALYAVDLQRAAVECARLNLPAATVLQGDLFLALPPLLHRRVDVIVANAPYVPTAALATLPREAQDYEPPGTHDGGADGLDLMRRIVTQAPQWLAENGIVLLECSGQQADTVARMLSAAGLCPAVFTCAQTDATVAVGSMLNRTG